MYVPDRKPVKCSGTFCMMPNQYCHFSSQPVPSNEKTTNCGAFCPGFSLVILKPSGSVPPAGTPPLSLAGTAFDEPVVNVAPVPGSVGRTVEPVAEAPDEDEVDDDEVPDDEWADDVADAVTLRVTVVDLPPVQAERPIDPANKSAVSARRVRRVPQPDPATLPLLVKTSPVIGRSHLRAAPR